MGSSSGCEGDVKCFAACGPSSLPEEKEKLLRPAVGAPPRDRLENVKDLQELKDSVLLGFFDRVVVEDADITSTLAALVLAAAKDPSFWKCPNFAAATTALAQQAVAKTPAMPK